MAEGPNLFARLHKWAARQDENFLTESLAVVLEHLLILAPAVGTQLIRRLTDGFIDVQPEDAGSIVIVPQVEARQGRPDLEISIPYRLVWVEVKVEADLRTGQLEGYRVLLRESGVEQTRLGLLTRYAEQFAPEAERPDFEIRWFQVASWLEDEREAAGAAGEVADFLCRQFLHFLRIKAMTLTQVEKYMPEGVRALGNLLNMLFEAAGACKVAAKKTLGRAGPGRDYIGLKLDGKYWVGIEFAEPEKLWFRTWCRIDAEAAAHLGVGQLGDESWIPGRACWEQVVELDSEDVHFYSRHKVGQFQWLESFLRECLVKARSIEIADQSPIPEDPEDS
ncbi:MAG: hypothetical protein K2R98_10970 [Gemmataceae bacterium]|nr:hypothetical protein [Gemmataceae bacterium]